MMTGTLQTLIEILTQVFAQLRVPISLDALEELAITVHQAMTGKSRLYHSLEHALGFWDPENPIQTIAALYHDIVYYHVDLGYRPEIEQVISPYLVKKGEKITLTMELLPQDRMFHFTLAVFGFRPGQTIAPENGLNEFLSALFMNQKLHDFVDDTNLLRMTVCIEATIPFRSADTFYRLEDRVNTLNQTFNLNLQPVEIQQMIKTAVNFANIDVKNFAENDVAILLDDTWKLLPEFNIALRHGIYTVREYRLALQKMKIFMCSLKPDVIFHQYGDTPPGNVYEHMVSLARENLATAQEYLKIKLLSAAVLEALAEVSGGDAPLSLFLGDYPVVSGEPTKRIEDFLPEPKVSHLIDANSKLFHLLEESHNSQPDLDLRNAPLSMFIYQSLDPKVAQDKITAAQRYFDGELTPREFLVGCKGAAISVIARAIAAMVPTRRERLLEYANLI